MIGDNAIGKNAERPIKPAKLIGENYPQQLTKEAERKKMPTNKDKIPDLKPTKDAKGGGGHGGATQAGGPGGCGGNTRGTSFPVEPPSGQNRGPGKNQDDPLTGHGID